MRRGSPAFAGAGKATFITPNHPEFFTDWMIDKEIIARVSPLAASWATHGVVNGLGRLAQKFWLANNLIAQIPGNSAAARAHSVAWALKGHGVLLHPEGAVGWHNDYVAPLMPGAVEMALEALDDGRKSNPKFQAWVAPVVWKLAFTKDVEKPLLAECAYVERRLKIGAGASGLSLAERVYRVYEALAGARRTAARADRRAFLAVRRSGRPPSASALSVQLARMLGVEPSSDRDELLRLARRKLRDKAALDREAAKALKKTADALARVGRVGRFAFADETVTQEQLAEHLKRIRNDYCEGSLRDTLNRFVPQPAGPRRAHIRVPEPLGLHDFAGSEDDALELLRTRMQAALDAVNAALAADGARRAYPNPFHQPQFAVA